MTQNECMLTNCDSKKSNISLKKHTELRNRICRIE